MKNNSPVSGRAPHRKEVQQLVSWLQHNGHSAHNARQRVLAARMTVFDDVHVGGDGFVEGYDGPAMAVLWPESLHSYDLYAVDEEERLQRVEHEFDSRRCDRCGRRGGILCHSCWSKAGPPAVVDRCSRPQDDANCCGLVSLPPGNINVSYFDPSLSEEGGPCGGYFGLQIVTGLGCFDVSGLSADELRAVSIMLSAAADRPSSTD